MNYLEMQQKQALPYEAKLAHAKLRAVEFYETIMGCGDNVHVSIGGLDSIALYIFLNNYCGLSVPGISVSSLEDKSIQDIHRQLGVEIVRPGMSKTAVINAFGFPVISKQCARAIEALNNPTPHNANFRHLSLTGINSRGELSRSKADRLAKKWIALFVEQQAPFKVSDKCCLWTKERPLQSWAKKNNSYAYLGLMATEGGRRQRALIQNGCNYYGKTITRSCPFAIFTRQDLLQLCLDLNVPVPKIYGEIKADALGNLYTARAQRTGCVMCGFGVHLEKRPHRFDRLREENSSAWEYWMSNCCTDYNGKKYGWVRVLDWIGVEWESDPSPQIELDLGLM